MSESKPVTFVVAVSVHGNARLSESLAPRSRISQASPGPRLDQRPFGPGQRPADLRHEPVQWRTQAQSKREVLERNFLASPCLRDPHPHQILFQEDFSSAALAYNDAIEKSVNDLIIFCHQDMFFPDPWMSQLQRALEYLDRHDPEWGVLGCSGVTYDRRWVGHLYSSGVGIIGESSEPASVQTLDEVVLILRKSAGVRFDETMPHFHLYGADICLRAAKKQMKSYAISAFCIHNTYANYILSPEFYECCEHMRRVWSESLPIQTTCIRITSLNVPIRLRRIREAYFKYIRRNHCEVTRADDVRKVFEELSRRI